LQSIKKTENEREMFPKNCGGHGSRAAARGAELLDMLGEVAQV